jgi:hypothetical protein
MTMIQPVSRQRLTDRTGGTVIRLATPCDGWRNLRTGSPKQVDRLLTGVRKPFNITAYEDGQSGENFFHGPVWSQKVSLGDTTSTVLDVQDTDHLIFKVGDQVHCTFGAMNGVKGEVVARRTAGRLLIKVAPGLYVEVPRICVEKEP